MPRQTATCHTCSSPLHFGTDGQGSHTEACPHCHWGWPVPRHTRDVMRCEHGEDLTHACERCVAKKAKVAEGLREYWKRLDPSAARAKWTRTANKGWATRRRKG
jgi:uncharacterized protein YbbK (DUF523 family)